MEKKPSHDRDPRPPAPKSSGAPATAETGWLPDLVSTGEKFEAGLAFFADALGRITRFSREPADLAMARRLVGQAALPGLVNTHAHCFHRLVRGRAELRGRADRDARTPWRNALERVASRVTAEDVFDVARMTFMEMLLSGITCVGEFHYLHHPPDGQPAPGPNHLAQEVIRAAHDVGIRIALLRVAWSRAGFGAPAEAAPPRFDTGPTERCLRDTDALHQWVGQNFPTDEAWVGMGVAGLAQVPLESLKTIAAHARSQRFRLHVQLAATAEENAACRAEYGRTPVALLAEHGIVDKRFTAVDAIHLSEEEIKILGTARATACVCPVTAANLGLGLVPVEALAAAGAGVALGTDSHGQIDLLQEARVLEYALRLAGSRRPGLAADPATALFHTATVTGARSLGSTGGALEVGRPADFFTVNLFDPALAGSDAGSLLAHVVLALERRAVREVWIGARQRLVNGRHALHGPIVGRFVEVQQRVWAGGESGPVVR